jgi:hypothetical protein
VSSAADRAYCRSLPYPASVRSNPAASAVSVNGLFARANRCHAARRRKFGAEAKNYPCAIAGLSRGGVESSELRCAAIVFGATDGLYAQGVAGLRGASAFGRMRALNPAGARPTPNHTVTSRILSTVHELRADRAPKDSCSQSDICRLAVHELRAFSSRHVI